MIKSARKFINTQGFKKYAFNTGWLFIEKILRIISELLIGIWVARSLGPEKFGIYSYAIAFVAIFGVVANLGLDQLLIKELIEKKEKKIVLLGTAFWLKIIGALMAFIVIALSIFLSGQNTETTLYIFIIAGGLLFQSFFVIDSHFQSKVQGKYISLSKIAQLGISAIFKVILILNEAELIWFVLVVLFDSLSLGLALFYSFWQKEKSSFFIFFNVSLAKDLIKSSWPYILTGFAIAAYMRIDQLMIKEMMDEGAVGIYSAAIRLSEGWYFVPTIITASLFPAILNAKKKGAEIYKKRLQSLFDLLTVISVTVGIFVSIFSTTIIQVLYGTAYIEAASVLTITIWAGLFVSYGLARGKWILVENLQRFSPLFILSGLFVNVILNLFLIPSMGIKGAAIATLISQGIVAIIAPFFIKQIRPSVRMILQSMFFISLGKKYFFKKS